MAKPKVNKILPFDAMFDQNITISWSGNQAYGNRIIIFEKESMIAVYDNTIETFSYSHTIPFNTLENGKSYIIQSQVYDIEWIESSLSDKYYFYTFKTPVFKFINIPTDGVLRASSFNAEVSYYQENFEPLSFYKFAIYDSSKMLLYDTDVNYDVNNLLYSFKGLENDTKYFIRCIGNTYHGMDVDTGFVEIYVAYEAPGIYSRLYAENDCDNGCVKYHTNINIIPPSTSSGSDFTYEQGKIDLTDKSIIYDEGFNIENDFTLKLNGTNLNRNGDIITLKNKKNQQIIITALIYNDNIRYKLIVPNAISKYISYSEPLSCATEDKITIVLRRINNIYQIAAYNGGDR